MGENGTNTWFIPVMLRSFCSVNIEYFPFDEQICTLKFGSWTYHGFELDLDLKKESADLKMYKSSGEFELLSFTAKKNKQTFRYETHCDTRSSTKASVIERFQSVLPARCLLQTCQFRPLKSS